MLSMKSAKLIISKSMKSARIEKLKAVGRVVKTHFPQNQVLQRTNNVPKNDTRVPKRDKTDKQEVFSKNYNKQEVSSKNKAEVPPEKDKSHAKDIDEGSKTLSKEGKEYMDVVLKNIMDQASWLNKITQTDSILMTQLGRFLQLAAAVGIGQTAVNNIQKYFKPEPSLQDILDAVEESKSLYKLKSEIVEMKHSLKILELELKGNVNRFKSSVSDLQMEIKKIEDCLLRVEAASKTLTIRSPTSENELKGDILSIKESLILVRTLMANVGKESPSSETELKADVKQIKDGMLRLEKYVKILATRSVTYQPSSMDFPRRIGEAPAIRSQLQSGRQERRGTKL